MKPIHALALLIISTQVATAETNTPAPMHAHVITVMEEIELPTKAGDGNQYRAGGQVLVHPSNTTNRFVGNNPSSLTNSATTVRTFGKSSPAGLVFQKAYAEADLRAALSSGDSNRIALCTAALNQTIEMVAQAKPQNAKEEEMFAAAKRFWATNRVEDLRSQKRPPAAALNATNHLK